MAWELRLKVQLQLRSCQADWLVMTIKQEHTCHQEQAFSMG